MVKIGLDAMGGDFAPEAAVKGAIMALDSLDKGSRIVLYGDESRIREVLDAEECPIDRFEIVATTEVIDMGDHPVRAFQQKSDSSLVVGFRHLAEGKIDGLASAGSTGAMMVGSTQVIKVIEGVVRPTISTTIPTIADTPAMLLDVGLNVDCRADVLEQYAVIGSIYAEAILGIENPRVALLNIGVESTKGNSQVKEAYDLLQVGSEMGRYNFVGNIEASHIFTSQVADVIVCDGFIGNTILKMAEGLYGINSQFGSSNKFWGAMNYELIGGTPILGINGAVTIGHGKSTPLAIKNMLLATEHTACNGLIERLKRAFE